MPSQKIPCIDISEWAPRVCSALYVDTPEQPILGEADSGDAELDVVLDDGKVGIGIGEGVSD